MNWLNIVGSVVAVLVFCVILPGGATWYFYKRGQIYKEAAAAKAVRERENSKRLVVRYPFGSIAACPKCGASRDQEGWQSIFATPMDYYSVAAIRVREIFKPYAFSNLVWQDLVLSTCPVCTHAIVETPLDGGTNVLWSNPSRSDVDFEPLYAQES